MTDLEMVMLRAQILGEDEAAQRAFQEQFALSSDASGLVVLVYAAFVIAARRKFVPGWTRSEVIRYVARVRALLSEQPGLLDPMVAEDELRNAIGEEVTVTHEVGAVAAARLCLLLALVASLDLDDQAVEDLLRRARGAADRMLGDMRS